MERYRSLSFVRRSWAGTGAVLALLVLVAAPAAAAPDGDRYIGETETGERVKLITNASGAVVRGAITAITDCSGNFDDFRARVEFGKPLDESSPDGFLHDAALVEEDDRFSGRYKFEVEGERQSDRVISGELTLKVTFRRDGEKYATCRADNLVFGAELKV